MKRGGPTVNIPVPRSLPSKKKSAAAIALKWSAAPEVFLTSQRTLNCWLPFT